MMTLRVLKRTVLPCAMALVCASSALAAPINYGNFNGSNPGEVDFLNVTEDSATDPVPLYHPPVRVGNQLFFLTAAFASSASNGATDTTDGTLTMTISAPAGYFLQGIEIDEFFSYSLLGNGTAATSSTAMATLSITDLVPGNAGTLNDNLVFSPTGFHSLPGDLGADVLFDGSASIDLTGLGVSQVSFELTNFLTTTSEAGTTSILEKRAVEGLAITVLVPEPMTVGMLGLGGMLLMFRRRRA